MKHYCDMKRVLILEDNEATLEMIKRLVYEVDDTCDVCGFDNVKDAYEFVINKNVDLFIIDIILDAGRPDDSSGLKFVNGIRQIEKYAFIPVIFVTSLEDPKLYTYEELHCYGYFEKPFDFEKFKALVRQGLKFPALKKEKKILYFRVDGIVIAVDRDKIVYAESINHVIYIHTADMDIIQIKYKTLKQIVEEADSEAIFQCSRNTVVNKDYIRNVDVINRYIILKDSMGSLEIGITYKRLIKQILKIE